MKNKHKHKRKLKIKCRKHPQRAMGKKHKNVLGNIHQHSVDVNPT